MSLLQFLPQCCDAENYLGLGLRCAQGGTCYDHLRPMGSILWFSLPYRLGLPPESLILANLLLLLVSVVLSGYVASKSTMRFLGPRQRPGRWARRLLIALLFGLSALVHVVFLRPVLFNSLSDGPAALLVLIAISLIVVARLDRSYITLGIAGALLGLAAWIRVFYLLPVVVLVGVYLVLWLKNHRRRLGELTFLVALIPILLQFIATYDAYGYVGYQEEEVARFWRHAHLSSSAMGYDTLLPAAGYTWSSTREIEDGLLGAWKRKDVAGAICLVIDRVRFYFGSYSPRTYMGDANQHTDIPKGKIRVWSSSLLALNAFATVGAAWFFIRKRRTLGEGGFIVTLLLALIFGEGLLIVPEQRFVLVFQVVTWVAFLASTLCLATRLVVKCAPRWPTVRQIARLHGSACSCGYTRVEEEGDSNKASFLRCHVGAH